MRNFWNKLSKQLFEGFSQWVKLNILLLSLTFILRLSFFFVLLISNNIEWSLFLTVISGVYFDIFLVMRITALLLIPFLILYVFLPKITYGIYIGFITVYCILYACLIGYYNNVMLPLDNVFFVYNSQEMVDIIISSVKFSILPVFVVIAAIILYILLLRFWKRNINISKWFSVSFVVISIVFSIVFNYRSLINNDKPYDSYSNYCLAVNQLSYTLNSFKCYYNDNKSEKTTNELRQYDFYDKKIIDNAKDYQSLFSDFSYVDSLYPFMRLFNDPDVLGDFMNKTSDNIVPNFVFVIVESMGRNLTAFQPVMSYTPFIDSLASQGLFWPNCLSLSERTFGVLPNIFSSAPYDKVGFARPWFPMPDHNSILKDMSKNGYKISYYYGGSAAFNGQDEFLSTNGVSYIMQLGDEDFDQGNKESLKENNAWGMYDGDMFKAAIRHKDSVGVKRPYTDIYLTLSTHEPFYFRGIESYEKRVVKMLESNNEVSDVERRRIMNNKNVYSCFLYLDDCMRMLFNYYRCQPGFENTVFIITGDHRMGRLYVNKSELLKYNVPLIIYSPLIKSPKMFKSVVTHHDITPTLNAYLKNNYDYNTDSICHWLGTSLDTTVAFSSKVIVPFMRNSREVYEFLLYDKFIVRDRIFEIDENLYPSEINDTLSLNKLQKYLTEYKNIDWYVTQNDYLLTKPIDKIENIINLSFDVNKLKLNIDKFYEKDIVRNKLKNKIIMEMSKKDHLYRIFQPIKYDKDYEKIYIDIICDYKITEKSKSDNLAFVFKMSNNEKSILNKEYKIKGLSSDIINDEEGFKRLRVKTTCFFTEPVTQDAIMVFYFKPDEGMTLQIKNFDIKIDAIPLYTN